MSHYRFLFLVFCIFYSLTVNAKNATTEKPHNLSSIRKEITAIQNKISHDEKNLNDLNGQLKKSEKSISSLTLKTSQLSKKIAAQKSQLVDYKEKKNAYEAEIKKQQLTLKKLIAANYSLQRQGRAGIYFSGNSAGETQRFLKYYQALDAAVITQISEIRNTIKKLNDVMTAISLKATQLQHSFKDYTNQINAIKKAQKDRQSAITNIHKTLNTNRKVLEQLQVNRKHLTSLVQNLAKPIKQLNDLDFEKQKGKLTWPTRGTINYLFQQPMANKSVRWQGDVIETKLGTPVHAIYAGKVIYSDWLRGYGLLIIIDHGNHYLSLYARNDTLNRNVGDNIESGDVIGTVGQSGGFQQPALYFELRHNTEAINPRNWFISA